MLNKVMLIGHLGQGPEIRRLENGAAVARFSLATNEVYTDRNGDRQESTEWHDVVAWRQLAETVEKLLHKGDLIYIEGKLSTQTWQDKEGVKRKNTEVVCSQLRLLQRKSAGHSGDQAGMQQENAGEKLDDFLKG